MAIETLVPNGTPAGGWENGDHNDVDEGLGAPDGNIIDTTIDDDFVDFDFTASAIEDADTVNSVTLLVRARRVGSGTSDTLSITLVIGGPQDTIISSALGDAFATFTFTDTTWNDDWTAAELDGAQIRLRATQTGMPTAATWEVDTIDMEIDFTAAGGGVAGAVFGHHQLQMVN